METDCINLRESIIKTGTWPMEFTPKAGPNFVESFQIVSCLIPFNARHIRTLQLDEDDTPEYNRICFIVVEFINFNVDYQRS